MATDDLTALVESLFERYYTAIFAYVYRLVGDRETAHDLTQETFVKLHATRQRLPRIENQRAWVYRIATNLTRSALQRDRRMRGLVWQQEAGAEPGASDLAATSATTVAVEQALAALPLDYRAPLLLFSLEGWSVAEVAAALEISEGAVKTRLYRARELFRQAYATEVA